MKIQPPYSWDLQEDILLKTGDTYTADYSYGFELVEIGQNIYERVPNYWKSSTGQLISNAEFSKRFQSDSKGKASSSYKFDILDLTAPIV